MNKEAIETQPQLLADLFRRWGYLQANLDPLERIPPLHHAELDAVPEADARQWRDIYCQSIGVEFMHMPQPERREWIAARMEGRQEGFDSKRILRQIASAELFEQFLHSRYVGTKRYSLEGGAALIPLLNSILDQAAEKGTETALIAMSHRGRLTVMLESVCVPASHIFAGFDDFEPRSVLGGGDLKYHLGATGDYESASGEKVHVHLVSNPSHLEAVNPVILGRVRAHQHRRGDAGLRKVLGITIHGDAAFAGQGIASETLNLSEIPGFSVGGMVQIVVNNLIGFTTEPHSLHSSRFSTDLARRLSIPIFHVNGEDPEAVVRVAHMASEYRETFHTDVVIDLICHRRYGHSEVDDPTTTQPLLYKRIENRPRLWEMYAEQLHHSRGELETLRQGIEERLDTARDEGRAMRQIPVLRQLPNYWSPYVGGLYQASYEVETRVEKSRLREIAERMHELPPNFHVHPKVQKVLEQRLEMGTGKRPVDWGMAEALAFGSLLWEGTPVRLSGQDTRRGTFNHRHAALVDYHNNTEYVPLRNLHTEQATFDVYNSTLSEAAEMGFAYGYSRDYPDALVCWEAQFGDFVNGAQVILDQFVCAGEDKWALLSGLVLLLPHGYEGQGPEHSSARLERFLQLAAEDNIQVCQASTAAQQFHLLRRQSLQKWRKPLVSLTPKGLLRAPVASSDIQEFAEGTFQKVIGDTTVSEAERVVVCSGKIVHELRQRREKKGFHHTAIISLEQIYPFPEDELRQAIREHPQAREFIWVQEEPANMGALFFVRPHLQRITGDRRLSSVKRSASASPATGSPKAHALEQKALLELAFASLR